MDDPLRDCCLPRDLAVNQQIIEIAEEIGDFGRLAEIIEGDVSALDCGKIPANWRKSVVTGKLTFGFAGAEDDVPALEISLAVRIPALCQRCLQPFELPLATRLHLLLGVPAYTLAERDGYEVWELSEDAFSPIDLVEETLIMAMPLSAMHEHSDDCVEFDSADVGEEMTTPFASLRAQMDDGK